MGRVLIWAALLITLGLLSVWVWRSDVLVPADDTGSKRVTETTWVVPACPLLEQACTARGKGGELRLFLQPPVRPLQAFEVVLVSHLGEMPDAVQVEFRMPGMMMGLNRFSLKQDATDSGRWHGTAMLPVCVSGRSDWVAEVSVRQGEHRLLARFPFVLGP